MAFNKRIYYLPKDTAPTAEVISNLLSSTRRKEEVQRYNLLESYYQAEKVTLDGRGEDLRVVTPFARTISAMNVGYLLGNPVVYMCSPEYNIDKIIEKYDNQTISNLDSRLAKDASKFSHGFERIYINEKAECLSARVDPRNIILVRDNSVIHEKMFAIIYVECVNNKGEIIKGEYEVTLLTKFEVIDGFLKSSTFTESSRQPHIFGEVPIVEFMNSDDLSGDYEAVLANMDAYNILQTARINDRLKTADAILGITGADLSAEDAAQVMDSRIATLPEGAKMEYIIKSLNEADSEVLRNDLIEDIHKISMTPDVSDKEFAGASSGVALQYKLLNFERHAKNKERCFEEALMERFRIYSTYLNKTANVPIVPTGSVDAVFTRALPQNDAEIAQIINQLTGIVDQETLVSQLSFVDDAHEVVELAKAEAGTKDYADDLFVKNEIPDKNKVKEQDGETGETV